MRIGLDVTGGDHAPDCNLDGAVAALESLLDSDRLVLVGDEESIRAGLAERSVDDPRVDVYHAPDVIGMGESPVEAVRGKPNSSIVALSELGSARKCGTRGFDEPLDAILSAGNTGACVTAAQMNMRRLDNVIRPGIAVTVPTFAGPVVLIDVGANIKPTPDHLAQYGVMGEVYARTILGVERPRVAIMNIGGEEAKGTSEMKRARDILRADDAIEFIGNIEGRGVFDGEADVVITDGVVGNVMLKLAEGLSAGIFKAIGREVARIDPDLARRFEPVVREIYRQHDYHEYGAAPLLGVKGICLISHGSSQSRAIGNAILKARQYLDGHINEKISERLHLVGESGS
ncbi:MAG: phosphate acyltransferase PlsX [Phycisphaerales bacterium]